MNPYEMHARQRKVFKLVDLLVKAGITVADAEEAVEDVSWWQLAATHLKINPPSLQTRREVVAALKSREVTA